MVVWTSAFSSNYHQGSILFVKVLKRMLVSYSSTTGVCTIG
jgi:hypothetical protein